MKLYWWRAKLQKRAGSWTFPSNLSSSSIIKNDQNCGTVEKWDEKGYIKDLKSNSVEENQREASPLTPHQALWLTKGLLKSPHPALRGLNWWATRVLC